jgi:nucleoside-diphosphate-sugar epimerase
MKSTTGSAPLWAISGISGFVGSRLAENLAQDGMRVRGLRRVGVSAVDCVAGDVRDRTAVEQLIAGADIIVHLAAYVHRGTRGEAERFECWSVNVDGTANVIEAMSRLAPKAFLIFVSTANVYGASDQPLTEEALCAPATPYGRSKLAAERLILDAVRARRIRAAILRPGVIFGPDAPGNVGRIIALIERGVFVKLSGGTQVKTLVPIANLIEAIRATGRCAERVNGMILNVAGGEPMTIGEIGDTIAGVVGRKPRTFDVPVPIARALARIADTLSEVLRLRLPSVRQVVDTYSSTTVLSELSLREATDYVARVTVRSALEETASVSGPRR